MNSIDKICIIFPVYNEMEIIVDNVAKVVEYLKNNFLTWEIIVVDNGSTDSTFEKISEYANQFEHIKVKKIIEKGLGIAFKAGLNMTDCKFIMLYAIDLPFGLEIIHASFKELIDNNADIIIGSKSHKKSYNGAPFKRKISSFIFNFLLKILFKVKVKDTQGSVAINKDRVDPILSFCIENNAFFCTQLVIYGMLNQLRIIEIPVVYNNPRSNSKIKIISDGFEIFKQLLTERSRYKVIRKNHEKRA